MGPSYVWWVESGDFPLIVQNGCTEEGTIGTLYISKKDP